MAETKLIKNISSELWSSTSLESFRDRKEPAPLFVFSSHLPLFHFHFLPSAQVAFILLNSIKFLPRDSYEGSFTGLAALGWDVSWWCFYTLMPRVVALNCKGLLSASETKAVIAIQWQHELLHVQPDPICLAWERNGVWQVVPRLFLFILSSAFITQDIW